MGIEAISFLILAVITLGSALALVLSKNIVHSALFLVLSFIGVAGLYLLMQASFLAAVQILVYGGAIAIVLVFGVMLTQRRNMSSTNLFNRKQGIVFGVVLALLVVISKIIWLNKWESVAVIKTTVNNIATVMLQQYVLPFEIVAILLLVAMIGAIVLAKKVEKAN